MFILRVLQHFISIFFISAVFWSKENQNVSFLENINSPTEIWSTSFKLFFPHRFQRSFEEINILYTYSLLISWDKKKWDKHFFVRSTKKNVWINI